MAATAQTNPNAPNNWFHQNFMPGFTGVWDTLFGGPEPTPVIINQQPSESSDSDNTVVWVVGGIGAVVAIAVLIFALRK